jgi:hypothetical protein
MERRSSVKKTDTKFRIRPGYILRPFLDECLVIPVGAPQGTERKISILNPVGEFVWQQLAGEGKTFSELLEAVLGEFEIDLETASRDITDFLDELKENQYLEMEE